MLVSTPKASEIVLGHPSIGDRAVPLGSRAGTEGRLNMGQVTSWGREEAELAEGGREKQGRSSVSTVTDGFCSRGCTEPFAEGLRAELLT